MRESHIDTLFTILVGKIAEMIILHKVLWKRIQRLGKAEERFLESVIRVEGITHKSTGRVAERFFED